MQAGEVQVGGRSGQAQRHARRPRRRPPPTKRCGNAPSARARGNQRVCLCIRVCCRPGSGLAERQGAPPSPSSARVEGVGAQQRRHVLVLARGARRGVQQALHQVVCGREGAWGWAVGEVGMAAGGGRPGSPVLPASPARAGAFHWPANQSTAGIAVHAAVMLLSPLTAAGVVRGQALGAASGGGAGGTAAAATRQLVGAAALVVPLLQHRQAG